MNAKNSKVKDSEALFSFIQSRFDKDKRADVIKDLAEKCMVTRYTIYNWLYGYCRIPALHKCKIEEVLGDKIFSDFENA